MLTGTAALLQSCLVRGARFSLDPEAGLLMSGPDDVLTDDVCDECDRRLEEIAVILKRERFTPDVALLLAREIVWEAAGGVASQG